MNWQDDTRQGRGPSKAGDVLDEIFWCIGVLACAVMVLSGLGLL